MQIKRLVRAITFSFLFGVPIWLLGTMFSSVFGQSKSMRKQPAIRYVIFDLGDVLLVKNNLEAFKFIGLQTSLKLFARYLIPFVKPLNVRKKLEKTASKIRPIEDPSLNARTQDGSALLAQIHRDWLSGKYSCEQCLSDANEYIANNPEEFLNKTEASMVRKGFELNFTPEILATMLKPTKEGIEFVKECKERGMEVLILSNMDSETAVELQKNYPELFELFDKENIFISGDMGTIKPDNRIFEKVLQDRNLDPRACVFFDDQQENVEAAQACGIASIHCPKKKLLFGSKPDIQHSREQLDLLIAQREIEAVQKENPPKAARA